MNSSSDKHINSHSFLHPFSLDLKNISLERFKPKLKKSKRINLNNLLHEYQGKKADFKYLEKYIHKYFINFYKNNKDDFNTRMIEDILNNESTHLVAEFKDYLIMGDITEFLQKSYNMEEIKKYLPKIYDYYNSCSVIFPNYVVLHESKYIYRSIRKKQKVIDNQQEQEEKLEKIKKGDIKQDDNNEFFSSKTFNSILEQTDTSNIKVFFGLDNIADIDIDETPNNIVEKLEQAENEAIQIKANLLKKEKVINDNFLNENNILNLTNINSNLIYNNIKNKNITERNKNKINPQYLSTKKKTRINFNNSNLNINMNMNLNNQKTGNMTINNYLSKNFNKKNESQKQVKSNSIINESEKDNGKKYSNNKQYPIYIKNNNENNSNKSIKKQYINALFPTKKIISKIFSNFNNNSVLKHNSFNFINQKIMNNNNIKGDNKYNIPFFPLSPSSNTIQPKPFKNKFNDNLNINIKESNSTRNIINHKLNENIKSKEKFNIKNLEEKYKKNKIFNLTSQNYKIDTISITDRSKNTYKDRVKYFYTNKNINYHNSQVTSGYSKSNNIPYFKTISNCSKSNTNIKNNNLNNINKNENYINFSNINDLNIHKFNSTSNIKKPINTHINNNSKNEINLNDGSYRIFLDNKIFSKSPLNIELETIQVSKKKRALYPKTKTLSDIINKNPKIINNNNYNSNIINSINYNTLSNDKNYFLDSLIHTSSNSNGQNKGNNIEKKNLILPLNNINKKINEYNSHKDSMTSKTSNNGSRIKYKTNNQDINYYNQEFKMKEKCKNIKKNNFLSNNNPVKIKRLFDIKNKNIDNQAIPGYFTSRK